MEHQASFLDRARLRSSGLSVLKLPSIELCCVFFICPFVEYLLTFFLSFILDVDECATGLHKCDANALCTDTSGSYQCTCKSPYTGNGKSCKLERKCNRRSTSDDILSLVLICRRPTCDIAAGTCLGYCSHKIYLSPALNSSQLRRRAGGKDLRWSLLPAAYVLTCRNITGSAKTKQEKKNASLTTCNTGTKMFWLSWQYVHVCMFSI